MSESISKKRYKTIFLSSSTIIASKFISALIGFVTVPLIINYLGKEQYGLWIAVGSIIAWLQLSDFGVSGGVVNVLAECKGKNDLQFANKCVSTALLFLIIVAVMLVILIVPLINIIPIDKLLNLRNDNLEVLSRQAFLIVLLFFAAGIPLGIINNVFTAYQKIYVTNWYRMFGSVLSLGLICFGIKCEVTFPVLLILLSISTIIINILLWIHNAFTKDVIVNFKEVDFSSVKRILKTCVPLFLFQIGAILINQLTSVMLANRANLVMVTDYSILLKIYLLVFSLGTSISVPFYSPIREAMEKRENLWVRKAIFRAVFFRATIVAFLSIPLVFFGSDIIDIWIKQPISSKFGMIGWVLLSICAVVSSISSTFSEVLTVLDDIWFQITVVLLNGIITIAGFYILIGKIGLYGVFIPYIFAAIFPIIICYPRMKFIINKEKRKTVCAVETGL